MLVFLRAQVVSESQGKIQVTKNCLCSLRPVPSLCHSGLLHYRLSEWLISTVFVEMVFSYILFLPKGIDEVYGVTISFLVVLSPVNEEENVAHSSKEKFLKEHLKLVVQG